jgi:hypothetical protein
VFINKFFIFLLLLLIKGDNMLYNSPHGEMFKESFINKGTNAAAISSGGGVLAIQDLDNAEKDKNLPHNAFTITNLSSSCTLFLFLDDYSEVTKPDYVLHPTQTITVNLDDGVSFNNLFVRNTHAGTDVAISELKYRISTIKRVQ